MAVHEATDLNFVLAAEHVLRDRPRDEYGTQLQNQRDSMQTREVWVIGCSVITRAVSSFAQLL